MNYRKVTALIYYHMGHALLLIYDPNHTGGINARRQQRVLEVCVPTVFDLKTTYSEYLLQHRSK